MNKRSESNQQLLLIKSFRLIYHLAGVQWTGNWWWVCRTSQQQVKQYLCWHLCLYHLAHISFGGCTLRAKRNLFAETKKSIIFITFHKQDTLSLQPNSENNGTESQAEMIYENHVRGGCPHLFPVEPLPTIYIHVSYHSCWSNDHERF